MTTTRLLLATALACSIGCAGNQRGRALVATPPTPSDYQPPAPFTMTERATGLLARAVFRSPDSDPYHVELEDLLIQPASSAVVVPLSQAAVVDVRSGDGDATVGQRRVALQQGATFAVPAGERLSIQPRGGPVMLRVVQIAGR
jgi:hypothetical protein